jgi:hypothetical protein
MAVYEALLLNTAVPQIQAAQAGDSYVMVVNATTPALRITQTGTGDSILVEDAANPDSSPFVVTAAGDVGIGTSSPSYKLEVNGGASDAMSLFNSTNANGAHLRFAASGTVKSFIGGAPGFLGSGTADDLGIRAVGSVLFATNGSSVDMTLDSFGALGIGTPTPNAKLAVSNAGAAGLEINPTGGYLGGAYLQGYNRSTAAFIPVEVISSSFAVVLGTTQAMTLDASGNLVVGATSALKFNTTGSASTRLSTLYSTGTNSATRAEFQIGSAATTSGDIAGLIMFGCGAGTTTSNALANVFAEVTSSSTSVAYGALGFSTANGSGTIERARITSGGYFKVSNSGAYNDSTGAYHELYQSTAGNQVVLATAASASYTGNLCQLGTNTAAGTGFYFIRAFANGVNQFDVRGDGNVTNTNGSYGTISDQKMKTDIVDAGSQWSDIKAMRFRKFKMKDDPSGLVQLGVVAQEVELTSPGLVDEHQDRDAEGNDLGTTTKSVKTSVLLMKAAVALQEAMARIETLEAKIAALEAK